MLSMKFLFQYEIISVHIRLIAVMFKIFFNYFICYISCAPNSVTNYPKMSPPLSFISLWEFLLKTTRSSAFRSLYNIADVFRRLVFYVHVYMILAYYSCKNLDILRITNLLDQVSTSYLNISFENMISICCNPYYMCGQSRYSMPHYSLSYHYSNME